MFSTIYRSVIFILLQIMFSRHRLVVILLFSNLFWISLIFYLKSYYIRKDKKLQEVRLEDDFIPGAHKEIKVRTSFLRL